LGFGAGGFGAIADAVQTTDSRGLSAFIAVHHSPSFLVKLAAGHVSIQHGLTVRS
jgi:3-oxoacyl-[acyl-carrier-protein] synthase II